MENDTNVSYVNPRKGKGNMVIGTLEMIAGGCLGGAGAFSHFKYNIDTTPVVLGGVGLFAVGLITEKFGEFQQWYSNKTYYR